MKKYFNLLKTADLFDGIEENELMSLLTCLSAKAVKYEKGQTVFCSGDNLNRFGIVLSGEVQIINDDYYGNRNILANIGEGNLFGESFACAEIKSLPVNVVAATECELMFIECRRLTSQCSKACGFHSRLIHNMLYVVARKNIALTQKIEITSNRTTREKLLAYFSSEAKKTGGSRFIIPFNRQELADYLSVERSAMSAELSKLRDDGIIKYNKNLFELL